MRNFGKGKGISAFPSALGTFRWLGAGLLLACVLGSGSVPVAGDHDTFETAGKLAAARAPQPEPTYSVTAGFDGEVFPALENYASLRRSERRPWGIVNVSITNPTSYALKERVTVEVLGWSDQEIQLVELGAGESRTLRFAPTFHSRLFRNREIAAATAVVRITKNETQLAYETTVPLHIRSADDMYWGRDFGYAQHIASWVTPHDPEVERILAAAKERMPGRRLPGYEPKKSPEQQAQSTLAQMRAVFEAVQATGFSYVKSSLTFGENTDFTQRIRIPAESLQQRSANCIDGAVAYASLFENLGLQPVVVLVPGHAYVGVRAAPGAGRYIYLETSLTGRASFERALAAAERGLRAVEPAEVLRVSIADARGQGVYPMPNRASMGDEEEAMPTVVKKKPSPRRVPVLDASRSKNRTR